MNASSERRPQSDEAMGKTAAAVRQQVAAMGSELFDVGLYNPNAGAGESLMIPRVWDAETLAKSVPWLRHQNREGRNIYIRPKGEHELSMVDDLTTDAVFGGEASGLQSRRGRGNLTRQFPGLAEAYRETQQGSEHCSYASASGEIRR
jgi:hypothetical protein